jgi:hypothetical protein
VRSRSAHILRMPGTPLAKDLPGLIYHQRVQRKDFWLEAATRTSITPSGYKQKARQTIATLLNLRKDSTAEHAKLQ